MLKNTRAHTHTSERVTLLVGFRWSVVSFNIFYCFFFFFKPFFLRYDSVCFLGGRFFDLFRRAVLKGRKRRKTDLVVDGFARIRHAVVNLTINQPLFFFFFFQNIRFPTRRHELSIVIIYIKRQVRLKRHAVTMCRSTFEREGVDLEGSKIFGCKRCLGDFDAVVISVILRRRVESF